LSAFLTAVLAALGGALAGAATTLALFGATLAHSRRDAVTARHLLHHDALTGLPSRVAALAALDRARHSRRPLAVALLDLDQFKAVNDTFGHPTGDEVLRQVAVRLAGAPPPVRLAARLHGDEFLLVIDGDAAAAQTAARTAWRAIAGTPLIVAGHLLRVTASVGVAATAAGTAHDELVVHADQAMYRAKSGGTGVHLHIPRQQPPPTGERPRRRYRDRPTTGPI
jgi:diguanylate cyclase (GGDEF)-like protein